MELPITLKFFHKIELYQELRREDKKRQEHPEVWDMAKALLRWTTYGHQFLYDPVRTTFIKDNILPELKLNYGFEPKLGICGTIEELIKKALGDLVVKGYAKEISTEAIPGHPEEKNVTSIQTSLEGLYMGEVINDFELGGYHRKKYAFFYIATWWLIALGIAKVVLSFMGKYGELVIMQLIALGIMTIACLIWLMRDTRATRKL